MLVEFLASHMEPSHMQLAGYRAVLWLCSLKWPCVPQVNDLQVVTFPTLWAHKYNLWLTWWKLETSGAKGKDSGIVEPSPWGFPRPVKPTHQREAAVYEAVPCCQCSYCSLTISSHRAEVNQGGLWIRWCPIAALWKILTWINSRTSL